MSADTSVFNDQAFFMQAGGQDTDVPHAHTDAQPALYLKLIEEEYAEFQNAQNDVDRADGVIDMLVVIIGYGLSRGWPMQALWDEVYRSNSSKIDPTTRTVLKRPDGKILKPASYSPPNLLPILYPSSPPNQPNTPHKESP